MSEDLLKRKCVSIAKEFRKSNPDFWFYCPTDKYYSGIPDIICCFQKLFGAAELKTPRGKLSQLQEHTLKEIEKAGGVTAVPRSADEFKAFLENLKMKGGKNI